jgi:hypothetical protein
MFCEYLMDGLTLAIHAEVGRQRFLVLIGIECCYLNDARCLLDIVFLFCERGVTAVAY